MVEQRAEGDLDKIPKDTSHDQAAEEPKATKDAKKTVYLSEKQIILEKVGTGHLLEAVNGKII